MHIHATQSYIHFRQITFVFKRHHTYLGEEVKAVGGEGVADRHVFTGGEFPPFHRLVGLAPVWHPINDVPSHLTRVQ